MAPKSESSLLGLVDLEESSVPQTSQPLSSFKLLGEDERLSMVRRKYILVVRSVMVLVDKCDGELMIKLAKLIIQ